MVEMTTLTQVHLMAVSIATNFNTLPIEYVKQTSIIIISYYSNRMMIAKTILKKTNYV